ncbi:MAG TPA: ATP-binding protein [Methylotenera sp.]|nr:ATP-binding protein [Methylotenera sp.]
MPADLFATIDNNLNATRWRSLQLYNGYRVLIALLFLVLQGLFSRDEYVLNLSGNLFFTLVLAYFIFSIISAVFTWLEKPDIDVSLPTQIIIDIGFIVLLMHAQEGSQSSIGLLLVIAIASASLISVGRLALFYAAIASIGILLEQSYRDIFLDEINSNFTPAVLLSLGCFATAWLAYSLAKRSQESELLASQRGLDVQNMAQINALITHEMDDGVLVVDHEYQVKHHNIQAVMMLGSDMTTDIKEEVAGIWHNKLLSEISRELNNMLHNWMKETVPPQDSSLTNILKLNTQSRELRLRLLPIGERRQQGAVIFIEDWSQMQTQAHQVKLAALGRLTANIAHEIRNPLSAISHANQLLQEEDNDPAIKRMLQIISDNVQRVDQIIKDVLELNRRDRTNQEVIHLENFITDFYSQFCAVEKIPDGCFKLEIKHADTLVSFDRRHLNQILWNLCKNGWRHSKNNQNSLKLTVSVSAKTQIVHIEISDDGEGIPNNVRSHLFEPFFTTEKTGTGLGLYIARELADANGAKLQFKTSGNGTQFIVYLKKV